MGDNRQCACLGQLREQRRIIIDLDGAGLGNIRWQGGAGTDRERLWPDLIGVGVGTVWLL